MTALDLVGESVNAAGFRGSMESLAIAFRVDYSKDETWRSFMNMLFSQVVANDWSEARFAATCNWLALNSKWANLTLADFFAAPLAKLYPYSWVLEEVHKDRTAMQRMEGYKIPNVPSGLWRYADGTTLPLEKIFPVGEREFKQPEPFTGYVESDKVRAILESSGIGKIPPLEKPTRPNVAEQKPNGTLTPEEIAFLTNAQNEAKKRVWQSK